MSTGFWAATPITTIHCDYKPPTFEGTTEGQTTTTNCSSSDGTPISWVWHFGSPPCASVYTIGNSNLIDPHLTTDVNSQCPCLIFTDNFSCSNTLGKWWEVKEGTFTVQPDNPLYVGWSEYSSTGLGPWELSDNNCAGGCNPVAPSYSPTYDPEWAYIPCSPGSHINQVQWQWSKADKEWKLQWAFDSVNLKWIPVNQNCTTGSWSETDFNGHYWDTPNNIPCLAKKPNRQGNSDGELVWVSCPTTNHLVMSSNAKAQLNYGKNKTNDLLVVFSVINPAPSDEIRIYFDNFNKYAYFKFSTVEDCNYTTVGSYPQFLPDDRAEEGEFGIYDGTQRIGHKCGDVCAYTDGGLFYGLWIRNSEVEGETRLVASCLRGSNAEMYLNDRGPGIVWDVASAYVTVSSPIIGFGSGQITTGRTLIASVNVQEAARSWVLQWADTGQLQSTDCSYSSTALYADYYAGCWAFGVDNPCCQDGIPPSEITVEISGVQNGQNSDNTQPNFSDPPCTDCTSINGVYVLTRNDECWDAGCDGYAYTYIGSCGCGSFTIGLEFYSGILGNVGNGNYGVEMGIDPCIPPIWQNCDNAGVVSNYGEYQPITPTGANGRMNCLGSDLIGATITLSNWGWGDTYLNIMNCFNGSITITGVSY